MTKTPQLDCVHENKYKGEGFANEPQRTSLVGASDRERPAGESVTVKVPTEDGLLRR